MQLNLRDLSKQFLLLILLEDYNLASEFFKKDVYPPRGVVRNVPLYFRNLKS